MLPLILGIVIFLGVHLVPTSPDLKAGLTERFGATAYKVAFGVLSLAGLVLIVVGYHKLQLMPDKNVVLWDPPAFTRHIAVALMLPAMIFLMAYLVPSRIRTAVKHPMLIAIKTWALAHLIANGDLASLILFGSFLAYAVYDRITLKRRVTTAPVNVMAPSPINDVIVVVGGIVLFAVILLWAHQYLIGVAPIPQISA
ncbi:MAG: NnrU family protein [Hyphomicrobiaceae bacterium]|jgi:uncharacterized membrane protein|nr:NnrU family protein [Hyphomicrobiaceae bacterium]